MNIFLYIKQAISAIKSNKLRSFLSTLGIIIGIMSFVIMLAIGEGAKREMLSYFAKESNVISINKKYYGLENKKETRDIFKKEIINSIPEKMSNIKNVLIDFGEKSLVVIYDGKEINLRGINPVQKNFFEIKETKKILGSYFGDDDYAENKKNVIIGYKLIKRIFGEENPIGKKLIIGGEIFFVSGVLDEKDFELDEFIFIPDTTFSKYFGNLEINRFVVFVDDEKQILNVKENLNYFLFKKSGVENFSDVGFEVYTNKGAIEDIEKSQNNFTYFLMFIGGISLLVGGIGIMNIMLVSVTERTREIGIRKAIGATNFTIMLQFLIESIILTSIGSAIAIGLSYLVADLMKKYATEDFYMLKEIYIDTNVLVLAIIVSVSMGIIFGIMPAYKAAKLKIIEALHFE